MYFHLVIVCCNSARRVYVCVCVCVSCNVVFTSVCTMAGLCVRSILTVWKMSTAPSYRILSRTILRVMKTPVRPTPALRSRRKIFNHRWRSATVLATLWSNYYTYYTIKHTLIHSFITESHCLPAVNADWSILTKLLLGFVHLANEINEALPRFGHALLWPVSELELTHCPWLAILMPLGNNKTYKDAHP